MLRQGLREQGLAGAGGADQQDVRLLELDVVARLLGVLDALVVVVDRDRELLLGLLLADDVVVEHRLDLARLGQRRAPACCSCIRSSAMMSRQMSTHSSQMNTVGPAISFLTSRWLLLQKEHLQVSSPLSFFGIVSSAIDRGESPDRTPTGDSATVSTRTARDAARCRCSTFLSSQQTLRRRLFLPVHSRPPPKRRTASPGSRRRSPAARLAAAATSTSIGEPVLDGLVGREDLSRSVSRWISSSVWPVWCARISSMRSRMLQQVAGMDLDVGLLAAEAGDPGLVDQDPAVRQARPLALGPAANSTAAIDAACPRRAWQHRA